MAFSTGPWYQAYAALGLDAFGLTPAEDQQLAGVLMWVPGGMVHAAAGIALLARILKADGATFDASHRALLVVLGFVCASTPWLERASAGVT